MQLVLDNVGRIYSWQWALQDVSAQIDSGNIVCILGANGSGKSTLLKLISGMMRPTCGSVTIDGRSVRMGAISTRKRMLLIQPDQPMIGKSVPTHLGTAISLYAKDDVGIEDTAAKWLDEFNLTEKVFSSEAKLSRGERTKLWLATLFTLRPELWLFDEPHQCGLDAHGVEVLEEQMRLHRKSGGIVVFTSQWPPHAKRLADRVILLNQSQLAYEGEISALSDNFDSRDRILSAIVRLLESESAGSVV